ncbi:transcription-repair coupling factor [Dinghuibacter silviterrae]|uniref:Transcription-repair-coupling factor n=1 Tax=Dinghuibacter silviterrae TaxID=1539049 RepID=A0A4R8DNN8_9BACT|nr:transcription-repair coupling factor [Dinghuibacter silviterrae]TDW99428.1 transcription-repair coupling factor (superfamily II helicase) [Dinghuibacter silviterrae]
MNLQWLLDRYSSDNRLSPLVEGLRAPRPQRFFVGPLHGSAAEFICAGLFRHPAMQEWNHLVVLSDAEAAAYFHNTVENLTGALDILYFPSSFKNRKNYRLLNSSHVMLRTEALMKCSAPTLHKKVLVTYPEALFEKVIVARELSGNVISVKVGDTLAVDALMERLVGYGFERTDFVYEPGQFAMRGGILDIYSFGNEKPYRVELFGSEVDSIRLFDPETQLSERKLLQVNIIPNIETNFDQGEKVSLLDFLPDNTVVWLQDYDVIREKLLVQEEDLGLFFEREKSAPFKPREDSEETLKEKVSPEEFVHAAELHEQLERRHLIEFGYKPHWGGMDIDWPTLEQPAFNRKFDLLIADLQRWEKKGFGLFLFAENPRQLERLHSIFTDLKAELTFTPLATAIHEGFIDEASKVVCYTDHQIFQRYHKYRVKQAYNKSKALTLRTLRELQPGDYVTHIDHGVGTYSGLQKIESNGRLQEAVRILYKDGDILYVNINSLHKISKYTGKEGTVPKINKIGSEAWQKLKEKTKTKVKEIAFDLIKLYAQRKAQAGFAHGQDNYLQTELEASFIYEDTPDQSKATADVKKDMESPAPMDRLVCGDVGFGKTEIAIRAAFKTVVEGKQAVVLVPTTILAFQHYKTFSERMKDFPVTVDYINRFKSAKEKKETLTRLQAGKIDIMVGTHALLGKEVKFKDLGLMVIDEEQKFGVGAKEKLKTLKTNVDCLTLTATPIPRTLQFSLMGARDLSIINTPPPNRQPIQTEVQVFNQDFIRDAIYFETERGGQVFFIHNRIQGLPEIVALTQALCPDLSIGMAHGQMEGHELEERIMDFIDRKYDVLVCTNIVESGVDIPNVNTIIVNNAHQFGLSDLHQLRGRVGRSNKKAFCYLLAPPLSSLPADSRKRLQTLEQHSELGSGFQIAMRDLDIRGAGNMLGGEQSGFMAEIGFEMYQKILDEAIRELKRTEFKELFRQEIQQQDDFVQDCTIDTDLEILIPDEYVESITERLSLYTRLDNCESEAELRTFHQELEDRFGPLPPQTEDLFTTVRCRRLAIDLGMEKLVLKDGALRCYFIGNPDSPYFESEVFQRILQFIQTRTNKARLRQVGKNFFLVIADVGSMERVHQALSAMHQFSQEAAA